jgi:hypothetical protein
LAGRIPELEFDAFATVVVHFLEEHGPEGRVQEIVELIVDETNCDAAFADSDAADDDDFGLLNHV